MKKLYPVLAALLLAGSMQARELTFYLGDEPIAAGTTLNFTGIEVTDYGDYKEVLMEPDLYVSSDIFTTALSVTATCTSGQPIRLCAGGNCVGGVTVTKKDIKVQTGEKLPLRFDYVGELDADEAIPTVTATIEAQDGTDESTHKSFTIVMGQSAGLTLIENSADLYFNGSAIVYSLDAPSVFRLYTAEGLCVLETSLEGEGTIATEGMAAGIYVYTLGSKTAKIFIK